LIAVLLVAGCSQPSRDDKIAARDDTGFELWLAKHATVFTPEDIKEINTARQQIRYKVMQARPGLMSGEFATAVYSEIEGRSVHELLLISYALQIERMKTELLNYQPQLERFQAHQRNRQLTEEQKETVTASLEKLHRLMKEHQEELSRLTSRLSELERQITKT
jgi:hypothetical protein